MIINKYDEEHRLLVQGMGKAKQVRFVLFARHNIVIVVRMWIYSC